MVRVTESALTLLREMKVKQQARPNQVLRMVAIEGSSGYELALGEPSEGDQVVEEQGVTLLHIGAEVAAALESSAIVSQSTPQGLQLVVTTPQPYPFGPLSQVIALRE